MSGLVLLEASDAHFAWMLGEAPAPAELRLPPGGVDEPWVLRWSRGNLKRFGPGSNWLMTADGEVVGMCGHKTAPDEAGSVEIGYGVAAAHRRKGHATAAVALIVAAARVDDRIRQFTAETATGNLASQRVLEANGFAPCGRGHDADEGETIIWSLSLDQTALPRRLAEGRLP
jgi:RimJ/RimL family protein N-acetyltransferase